jgi:DNA-binding response OmpR family regulator
MSGRREETALGVARARFVEGLSRRTRELKGALALLTASPDDARAREELRRRLHALFASAQVFRIEPLADALKACITHLDAARDGHRGLEDAELEEITRVAADLKELAGAAAPHGASVVPAAMTETIRAPSPTESPEIDLPPIEMAALREPSAQPAADRASARPYRVPSLDDLKLGGPTPERKGNTSPVEARAEGMPAEPPEPAAAPPAKPRGKDRESVEEKALRQATVPAPAPEMAEPDDPFDTAVTSTGGTEAPAALPASSEGGRPVRPNGSSWPLPLPIPARAKPSTAPASKAPRDDASKAAPKAVPVARMALQKRGVGPERPVVVEVGGRRRTSSRPLPNPATASSHGLTTVVSVLVVDDAQAQSRVRAALPLERFELLGATDPEEALRLARASAPDVVLVNEAVVRLPDLDFISRLRGDPLTDGVPVLLIFPASATVDRVAVRDAGADDAITEPIDPERLAARIAALSGLEGDGAELGRLGDLTVGQVVDRMADELRRGLADSIREGAEVAVPLGPGTEVLAAAWSAVARVRAHLAELSHGRVQFRDLPRRGAPAVLGLAEGLDDEGGGPEIALAGRRLLIADDDPAVLWFFSQLLKEAGAEVVEAEDGFEALHLARQRRPEVVLSDILMPRMDGMALCRELARDPAVGAVPVILLSWKDDFLQRMRELRAGAHGYLRKEEGTTQILRRVREALRPRVHFERRLRAGGEVRGRIDQLGVVEILRTVAHKRPDARITVRDAFSLFEVDIRRGALVDVTRTASDGSFARGAKALPLLVGVIDGRFTVVESDVAVRPTLEAGLDATLDAVCTELGAVLDAVSGPGLGQASKVDVDPEIADAILATSPGGAGEVLEKLKAGAGPLSLLVQGGVEPRLLESVLLDLARRGGVRRVLGANGEDRVAEALEARRKGLAGEARHVVQPVEPPGPSPEIAWLREAAEASERPAPLAPSDPPRSHDAPHPIGEADELLSLVDELEPSEPARAPLDDVEDVEDEVAEALLVEAPDDALDAAGARDPGAYAARVEPAPDAPVVAPVPAPAPIPAEASVVAEVAPPAQRSALRFVGWAALLAVLSALGFFGAKLLPASEPARHEPRELAAADEAPTHVTTAPDEPAAEEPPAHVLEGEPRLYGRVMPGIVAEGLSIAPGQGLLRVEADAPREGLELLVGGRSVGAPPLDLPLEEGLHELVFKSGDQTRYRYVFVRAGESRVVPAP